MRGRRKNPQEKKHLSYTKQRRETAWFQEAGLRLRRRARKRTRSRAARRAERRLLTQKELPIEEMETLDLDSARTEYRSYREPPLTLSEAIELKKERRLRRSNRKSAEARTRRAARRSRGGQQPDS